MSREQDEKSGKFLPHVPTDNLRGKVEGQAVAGIPHKKIAEYIGIDEKTLVKHYKEELNNSLVDKICEAANALYQRGVFDGDTTALIFWLKTRGRWSDKQQSEEALDLITKVLGIKK